MYLNKADFYTFRIINPCTNGWYIYGCDCTVHGLSYAQVVAILYIDADICTYIKLVARRTQVVSYTHVWYGTVHMLDIYTIVGYKMYMYSKCCIYTQLLGIFWMLLYVYTAVVILCICWICTYHTAVRFVNAGFVHSCQVSSAYAAYTAVQCTEHTSSLHICSMYCIQCICAQIYSILCWCCICT